MKIYNTSLHIIFIQIYTCIYWYNEHTYKIWGQRERRTLIKCAKSENRGTKHEIIKTQEKNKYYFT